MKHTTFSSIPFLALSALIASVPALHAADQIQVRWDQLCQVAHDRQLTITTATGETVSGYCMSSNADEIALNSKDNKIVKIARSALQRIQMSHSTNGHQLSALGRTMQKGLRTGADWLLSPRAPLGIVAIPATLAWGAVAAPFCILGDLIHEDAGTQEVKVL
jgi:hypothetical protein